MEGENVYRKAIIILSVALLAGCWDERLYKNSSVVSLAGIEGTMGEYKGYYAYPKTIDKQSQIMLIEAKGISPRDVRNNADMKVEQTLDLSELATLLISIDTVKEPLYDLLDIYFRDPQNPISIKVALTEGSVKPFVELTKEVTDNAGGYYERFIESTEKNTIYPKLNLQMIGSTLFDNAKDIAVPYIKMDEEEHSAEAAGVALFSGQVFTGKILNPKQSFYMLLLMDKASQHARIEYMLKLNGEDVPVTSEVIHLKRKWIINEEMKKITMDFKIDLEIEEFSKDHLYKEETFKTIEDMFQQRIQADFEEVLNILQEEKSDTLGIGRYIRAHHPKFFQQDWREQFASLTIEPKVKVTIIRTGILR